MPHDFRRQPVRRVVFAKPMALIAVDQRLVQDLQHVAFHLIEAKAAHMRQDAAYQRFTIRVRHHPIEEVALR
ncbi:MAG: hypothetical protein JO208_00715, partial [Alphaproteobacteria bacterium]|nr:hypothetical protein [Alphaproteobacteria bacterium]